MFYEAIMVTCAGATLGKWVMGIRICSPDGGRLSFGGAFRRANAAMGKGLYYFVLFPLATIALHDSYRYSSEYRKFEWDGEDVARIECRGVTFWRHVLGFSLSLVALLYVVIGAAISNKELIKYAIRTWR
jgi:uncharacterized RDD family membrane protein YckC